MNSFSTACSGTSKLCRHGCEGLESVAWPSGAFLGENVCSVHTVEGTTAATVCVCFEGALSPWLKGNRTEN